MQPETIPNRRRLTIVASALLLAILLIMAYFVFGVGEDEDEDKSTNTTPQVNIQQEDTTRYPVTIIIIDDFSGPLTSLVDRIDESLIPRSRRISARQVKKSAQR